MSSATTTYIMEAFTRIKLAYFSNSVAAALYDAPMALFGASGELRPLETIFRDSKIGEIYEGANEVMLTIIARSIFGRNFVD